MGVGKPGVRSKGSVKETGDPMSARETQTGATWRGVERGAVSRQVLT